jgi:hypothetical protein
MPKFRHSYNHLLQMAKSLLPVWHKTLPYLYCDVPHRYADYDYSFGIFKLFLVVVFFVKSITFSFVYITV